MIKSNHFYIYILLLSVSFFSSACNNDDDDNGITTGDCFATWNLDGVAMSEDNMALCVYLDNTLNLSTTTTGGTIQIQVDPITSTGTYTVDVNNPDISVIVILRLSNGSQLGIKSGSIVVTELSSSKAKGTFSGQFYDLMDLTQSPDFSVTNGVFEANF